MNRDQRLAELGGVVDQYGVIDLRNSEIDDADLELLASFPEAEGVQLMGAPITGSGLQALAATPRVRSVNLALTPITDDHLEHLLAAPFLRELNLDYCEALTQASAATLSRMPSLEVLNISGVRFETDGFGFLQQLTNLRFLAVAETAFGDASCRLLKSTPELEQFFAAHCELTDASLPSLCGCRKLEVLEIQHTAISASGRRRLNQALPHTVIYQYESDHLNPSRRQPE